MIDLGMIKRRRAPLGDIVNFNSCLSSFSVFLLLLTIVWLPIMKSGKFPSSLAFLCIFCVSIVLFESVTVRKQREYSEWLLVWLVFSLIVLWHMFSVPSTTMFFLEHLGVTGVGDVFSQSVGLR